MHGVIWTEEEENRLRDYIAQGMSYYQVSLVMNKSKNSVLGKANRLQLTYEAAKKRKKSKPRVKKVAFKPEPYVAPVLLNAPVSLKLKVFDLEKQHCRYIEGNDRTFCGHKKIEDSSYCEYHNGICHTPTLPLI